MRERQRVKFLRWTIQSLLAACWMVTSAYGQSNDFSGEPENEPARESAPINSEKTDLPPPKLPKKVQFSKSEIAAVCRKYEGQFIGYYDQIFKVENCKRRELITEDGEAHPLLQGKQVKSVEGLTIAKIPVGESLLAHKKSTTVDCTKWEGRYVLSRGDEVFYIEKCKKHLIPDWDTYSDHAHKKGKKGMTVVELSESEMQSFKTGADIKSVLDDEYKKLLDEDKGVDIIPLVEACKGLNGKFVSYYSKIYRVESCKKMPVDAEKFVVKHPGYKLQELSSEQWVSLPTGKSFTF